MANEKIQNNYQAQTWAAGDKLTAVDMSNISATLDKVQNYIVQVSQSTLPNINQQLQVINSKIDIDQPISGFVSVQIDKLVNGAPGTLDTLGEIATAFQQNGDVIQSLNQLVTNNANLIATKADKQHTHTISQISNLQQMLQAKIDSSAIADMLTKTEASQLYLGKQDKASSVDWDNVQSKPSEFTPAIHIHTIDDVQDLKSSLQAKQDKGDYVTNDTLNSKLQSKAETGHNHTVDQVNNLQQLLSGKVDSSAITDMLTKTEAKQLYLGKQDKASSVDWVDVQSKPSEFTPATHTHQLSEITDLSNQLVDKSAFDKLVAGTKFVNGTLPWNQYSEQGYAIQLVINVQQSFFELGNPVTINGTAYDQQSNNYKIGSDYIAIAHFDKQTFQFQYHLYQPEIYSQQCGQFLTSVINQFKLQQQAITKLTTRVQQLQQKLNAN